MGHFNNHNRQLMKDTQITSKHMKICSTSYDIKKMQVKTIMLLE